MVDFSRKMRRTRINTKNIQTDNLQRNQSERIVPLILQASLSAQDVRDIFKKIFKE